jgi:hypothetical protein
LTAKAALTEQGRETEKNSRLIRKHQLTRRISRILTAMVAFVLASDT